MKARDFAELLALAAVWGASFLFMRVLAPVLGPWATADLRMLLGAAFLGVYFFATRFDPGLRRHAGVFLVVGLVNSALPFALYSAAALVLPASAEVVLNALSPVFGAVAGAWFLDERFTVRKASGLALGFAGVAVLSGGLGLTSWQAWAAFGACLLAPACYAAGGVLVNKLARDLPARSLAFGSQALAGLAMLPTLALGPVSAGWTDPGILFLLIVFGVLCSGVAYLLYYGLMKRVGPTKTLAVTFLMPVFGILWGAVFLGEAVDVSLIGGALLVVAGTFLVTR